MKQSRILVADDDPIVIRFLSAILRDEGYDVITATDGEKALQVIQKAQPDLVILDLVMPFRDGFEICHQIKASPQTSNAAVIVLSMKEKEQDVVRAFAVGADDYVRKPFNALELVARVRKLLSKDRVQA